MLRSGIRWVRVWWVEQVRTSFHWPPLLPPLVLLLLLLDAAGGESQNRKLVPPSSNAANFCFHHQSVVKKIEMVFLRNIQIFCDLLEFMRSEEIHAIFGTCVWDRIHIKPRGGMYWVMHPQTSRFPSAPEMSFGTSLGPQKYLGCRGCITHSLIISREVLILTLSIFNALKVCISWYSLATGLISEAMIYEDHIIQYSPCALGKFFLHIP